MPAEAILRKSPAKPGICELPIIHEALIIAPQGFFKTLQRAKTISLVVPCKDAFRSDFQRTVATLNSVLEASQLVQSVSLVNPGNYVVRIKFQGFVAAVDGLFVATQAV